MSTELVLFSIVGFISVAAAFLMLMSQNAVHSALFLILNLTTVAFLYLMLDAPFLALVQIAVYAGAIMVLFLFVIMLLGAEQLGEVSERQHPWMLPTGMVLAGIFFAVAVYAVNVSDIRLQPQITSNPSLRVAHAGAGAGAVDVFIDGEMMAEDVSFADTEAADYHELTPGDHTLVVNATGTENALVNEVLSLVAGEAKTAVVLFENDAPSVQVFTDDLATLAERDQTRLVFFNSFAAAPAVSVIDLGANGTLDFSDEGDITDTVIVSGIAQYTLAQPQDAIVEGELTNWVVLNDATNDILYRMNRPELFTLEGNTSGLIVIAAEPQLGGTIRARAIPFFTDALPSFGGPESIGALLFSAYLLPFELVSLLLLVAMIGAIILTQRVSVPVDQRRRDVRRRVSRPLTSVVATQTGQDIFVASSPTETPTEQEPDAAPAGD